MDAPGLPQKTLHALDDASRRLMSNGIYVLYVLATPHGYQRRQFATCPALWLPT